MDALSRFHLSSASPRGCCSGAEGHLELDHTIGGFLVQQGRISLRLSIIMRCSRSFVQPLFRVAVHLCSFDDGISDVHSEHMTQQRVTVVSLKL